MRLVAQAFIVSVAGVRPGRDRSGRGARSLTGRCRNTVPISTPQGNRTGRQGEIDSTDQYRSARSGPKPALFEFTSEADEIEAIAGLIRSWTESDNGIHVGVLARTKALVNKVVNGLADHGIEIELSDDRKADGSIVQVMTMHSAKGMEFTHVVLIGVGANVLPQRYQLQGLADAEADDARQRERSLLYVAASRARDQLVITTHEELSELLPT